MAFKNKENHKEYCKNYHVKNKIAILDRKRKYYQINKEKQKEWCKNYYLKNKESICNNKKEYNKKNKEKHSEYCKMYYLQNRYYILYQSRKYRGDNREKYNNHVKEYRFKNKEHFREYGKNRKLNDCGLRIIANIRTRIISAIKNGCGLRKAARTKELIGCSVDFLKNYLQQTAFNNGYFDFDINNYSGREYHIDHIVPCSVFNFECSYHQRLCFHYSNLQILKANENIRKSNRLAA